MRSRFTAFALGDADYLLKSWHPTTRPRSLQLDPDLRWYRLDIIGRSKGALLDTEGTVEFVAHYRSPAGSGEPMLLAKPPRLPPAQKCPPLPHSTTTRSCESLCALVA